VRDYKIVFYGARLKVVYFIECSSSAILVDSSLEVDRRDLMPLRRC
jgi:hypothetical protein